MFRCEKVTERSGLLVTTICYVNDRKMPFALLYFISFCFCIVLFRFAF